MTSFFRKLAFLFSVVGLALAVGVAPSFAQAVQTEAEAKAAETAKAPETVEKVAKKLTKKKSAAKKAQKPKMSKEEIKQFQREHGLKVDGIVGKETRRVMKEVEEAAKKKTEEDALMAAKAAEIAAEPVTPPDPIDLNAEINQDDMWPLTGGAKILPSRYGHIEVVESGEETKKNYVISMNGQPLLTISNQPSVIGVSKTYDLDNEDAIVVTTFNQDNHVFCPYKNHVLVISPTGTNLLELENCTRGYTAQKMGGSLYITFIERESNRPVGAAWKLEGMALSRL